MVNDEKLSRVLSEFARTVITDFPIQGILDHLVARIVDVLPVTSAGVTLIAEGEAPRYVAASDGDALRFERLQTDLDQGPCLAAYRSGEAVLIPDLAKDERFPLFARAAVRAGLAAAFTFPLRHGDDRLGALDLYRDTPGDLDAQDRAAAQTLADVTAAYLLNAQARDLAHVSAERLQHLSMHDPLTGLPNRVLLQARIDHAERRATRSQTSAAVLFVDLDDFKLVNDTHGHHVGDDLLCAVAQRLTRLLRPGDSLARFSGDEFVILCEDLADPSDADGLARRINETLTHPFVLPDATVTVTASVGVAFAGPGENVSNALIIEADRAMYAIKDGVRGNRQVVDARGARPRITPDTIEEHLRVALATDRLDLAFQPIVRGADAVVTGVEALLRWRDPRHGTVPPASIVTIAERCGLIIELGAWVLERACRDHHRWLGGNPGAELDVAVNVSGHQLAHRSFPTAVADIIARTGMDPRSLVLEMTEDVFIDDGETVMAAVAALSSLGIRLSIDDFGTGYSSLSYLSRLPISIVKLDRLFITDTATRSGRIVVNGITNLAHDLGLTVVAEGVETRTQHDRVVALGCDAAQGYYYARPMTASEFSKHHGDGLDRGPLVEQSADANGDRAREMDPLSGNGRVQM